MFPWDDPSVCQRHDDEVPRLVQRHNVPRIGRDQPWCHRHGHRLWSALVVTITPPRHTLRECCDPCTYCLWLVTSHHIKHLHLVTQRLNFSNRHIAQRLCSPWRVPSGVRGKR